MQVPEVDVQQALSLLNEGATVFLDVRDSGSYRRGHIPGAQHIGDHNVEDFVENADKSKAVVIYCYHGNSSLGGAAHLLSQGFEEVYSMSGGFAAWADGPIESAPQPERQEPPPRAARSHEPVPQATRPLSRRKRLFNRLRGIVNR